MRTTNAWRIAGRIKCDKYTIAGQRRKMISERRLRNDSTDMNRQDAKKAKQGNAVNSGKYVEIMESMHSAVPYRR